ncbi:hypothetical protein D9M68_479700 [compost metagenome]
MDQHQAEHDTEDFTAAEALGGRPADQGREEHEGGIGHQVDQVPQAVELRIGVQQGTPLDEHVRRAEQVVQAHQQAGDDDRRQDRHEHVGEDPHQALQAVVPGRALLLDVGDGRRRQAGELAQRRIDLLHLAGADDHLEHARREERALDQLDLAEPGAVDPRGVLQGQAQAGHAMGCLLDVFRAAKALQDLAGNLRIVVAHALASSDLLLLAGCRGANLLVHTS